jgi:excisionase family DNA binding protein
MARAIKLTSLGKDSLYRLMNEGKLEFTFAGKRRLIRFQSLKNIGG